MNDYTIYDMATGKILSTGTVANKAWLHVPIGQGVLWEILDQSKYLVVGGIAVERPPVAPVVKYSEWNAFLADGYTDAETGIRLKTTEHARSMISQQYVLMDGLVKSGMASPESSDSIYDYYDNEQTLTITQLSALILRYGVYCAKQFKDYAP